MLFTIAGFCLSISLVILPGAIIAILMMKDLKKIKSKSTMRYFGAFFEEYKGTSKICLAYYLVFMLRRFTYVAVSSLLSN